jgi:hypothetical protein
MRFARAYDYKKLSEKSDVMEEGNHVKYERTQGIDLAPFNRKLMYLAVTKLEPSCC